MADWVDPKHRKLVQYIRENEIRHGKVNDMAQCSVCGGSGEAN